MQKQEIEGKSQTSGERNMTGKENSLKRGFGYLLPLQQAKRR